MLKKVSGRSPAGSTDLDLGAKLREARKARGLSQQQVASRANLSIGLISQIERGLTSPSVRSLCQLSDALGVPVAQLFANGVAPEPEDRGIVMHRENRRILNLADKGLSKEILSQPRPSAIGMLIVNVEPGGSSGSQFYHHEGEEIGLVLSGRVELWVGDGRFLLKEGDSFHFSSSTPHKFANPGRKPARIAWAMTPPIY